VDIGYNLDMSLGTMAEYAVLTGDTAVRAETVRALQAHLRFVFPDGSIDNSFGCRSYKWTLFGSKTACGCQVAFGLLADADPAFARAAQLNACYLERLCSPEGVIGYGPDYWEYYRLGCIHSTFNRADALAIALAYGQPPAAAAGRLPSEEIFGVRRYASLNVMHARTRHLLATVSAFATKNAPSGGALSYLWSDRTGPVQVGCVTEYDRLDEPQNIPEYPAQYGGPITPRLEALRGVQWYSNLNEYEARLESSESEGMPRVSAAGRLKAKDAPAGEDSGLWYAIAYTFGDDWVEKVYRFDLQHGCDRICLVEPVVCSPRSSFAIAGGLVRVAAPKGQIEVSCVEPGSFSFQPEVSSRRIFSVFPSLACLPLTWQRENVAAGVYQITVRICVREDDPADRQNYAVGSLEEK
jgi:hypothetical protein